MDRIAIAQIIDREMYATRSPRHPEPDAWMNIDSSAALEPTQAYITGRMKDALRAADAVIEFLSR